MSPSAPYSILAFVPEDKVFKNIKLLKGKPALARIFTIDNFDVPLASKSFFKAESAEVFWNNKSNAALVLTHTDADRTGKSYYGGYKSVYYL